MLSDCEGNVCIWVQLEEATLKIKLQFRRSKKPRKKILRQTERMKNFRFE